MSEGYQALRHAAAWLDLSARGRIVARGRDRTRFLHNVTSNDVKSLKPGAGCYAFLLTPQGRIQADLYLWAFPEHFLIDTEPELAGNVPQLILKYKVADQIELEDVTATTAAVGVEGPAASAVLSSLGAPAPEQGHYFNWGENTVAGISVTGQPGFRIYTSPAHLPELTARLEFAGAKPATTEDVRLVRIENGKPRYGEDIQATSLPQETQQMHAVSFQKGCYVGQEIVERIRARGHVNRQLIPFALDQTEIPAPGAKITVQGAETEVTSAAYSPALGKVVGLGYARVSPRQ
jgi:folate-binding protein YgfZ